MVAESQSEESRRADRLCQRNLLSGMRPIVRDAALVVSGVLLSGIVSWLREVRRRRLANAAPTKVIQVVGDIYLDMIAKVDELPHWDGDTDNQPIETTAGGSALNTAVQLSTLCTTRRAAHRCELHSLIGEDLYGDLVKRMLDDAGVTRRGPSVGRQGVCICLSGKRDRAFVSYKGSVGELSAADIDERALLAPGTSHLHFSAYFDCAALQPSVPRLMERAKVERGATISVVPQTDPAGEWGSGFLELLPNVDVLICNQREAAAIAGVPFGGDRRPTWAQTDAAVRRLQRAGAPLVVVTLGPEGAIAVSGTKWWYQPNAPLPVTDATGCGDAFAAGFLFGWCGSRDVRRGLVYGCACGSAAVGQVGGSTPLDPTEVDLGMRRNSGAEDIWQSPTDRVPFADLTRVATTGGAAIPDVRKR